MFPHSYFTAAYFGQAYFPSYTLAVTVTALTGNVSQYQGEDRSYQYAVTDANGNAVDLTGWLVTFCVHEYGDPTASYFTKTVGTGVFLNSPATGTAAAAVTSADTANMLTGGYEYYVERTNPGGDAVYATGLFTVKRK